MGDSNSYNEDLDDVQSASKNDSDDEMDSDYDDRESMLFENINHNFLKDIESSSE